VGFHLLADDPGLMGFTFVSWIEFAVSRARIGWRKLRAWQGRHLGLRQRSCQRLESARNAGIYWVPGR